LPNAPRTKNPAAALFPRSFRKNYPEAVRAEGCYIFTADGRKILDASGGAAVVSIGHGVASVAEAVAAQTRSLAYVHSSQFSNRSSAELSRRLLALAPRNFRESPDGPGRVLFTSGGSEAAETALKLCRQFFLERGEASRTKFVSRAQSYHGATLGALALSGNFKRREPFLPLLPPAHHIPPCYCYRCPLALEYPSCLTDAAPACANELDHAIHSLGPENVAAFFAEPVSGATLGAVAPPPEYFPRIAEICRRHGVLLVADEVMTGMGRTGKNFAVDHWNVEPDIILAGKGIAGGYAPLGAVIVTGRIASAIERGSGSFLHGFTYSAHPVSAAAGLAVLDFIAENNLFARVAPAGLELLRALDPLRELPMVGDVRGTGLLLGIEFVRDKKSREPFDPSLNVASRVYDAALRRSVLTYPISGCAAHTAGGSSLAPSAKSGTFSNAALGDHILLAPPFTISSAEIRFLADSLRAALAELSPLPEALL